MFADSAVPPNVADVVSTWFIRKCDRCPSQMFKVYFLLFKTFWCEINITTLCNNDFKKQLNPYFLIIDHWFLVLSLNTSSITQATLVSGYHDYCAEVTLSNLKYTGVLIVLWVSDSREGHSAESSKANVHLWCVTWCQLAGCLC